MTGICCLLMAGTQTNTTYHTDSPHLTHFCYGVGCQRSQRSAKTNSMNMAETSMTKWTELPVHEHEQNKRYLLRVQRGRPANDRGRKFNFQWENCRVLKKYQSNKGVVWCDIEIEPSEGDDHPFRPKDPTRCKFLRM